MIVYVYVFFYIYICNTCIYLWIYGFVAVTIQIIDTKIDGWILLECNQNMFPILLFPEWYPHPVESSAVSYGGPHLLSP